MPPYDNEPPVLGVVFLWTAYTFIGLVTNSSISTYINVLLPPPFATVCHRLQGNLNLSRAIGDLMYKVDESLSPEEQMITADPELQTLEITDEDEFIVLACDGVWNSLSSQEVGALHERWRQGWSVLGSMGFVYFAVSGRCSKLSGARESFRLLFRGIGMLGNGVGISALWNMFE